MFYNLLRQKLPKTYGEIHDLVVTLNSLSKIMHDGHSWLNYSFVEKCLGEYKSNLDFYDYNKISFHQFLFKRQEKMCEMIYPNEKDNLWLVVYSPDVTKIIIVDKKEIIVPLLPKFEPFIIDTNTINQGWCGKYLDNMRKYILISGDNSKKTMIENVLNTLKAKTEK